MKNNRNFTDLEISRWFKRYFGYNPTREELLNWAPHCGGGLLLIKQIMKPQGYLCDMWDEMEEDAEIWEPRKIKKGNK